MSEKRKFLIPIESTRPANFQERLGVYEYSAGPGVCKLQTPSPIDHPSLHLLHALDHPSDDGKRTWAYHYMVIGSFSAEELQDLPEGSTFTIEHPVGRVYDYPKTEIVTYGDCEVQCCWCEAKFDWRQLGYDESLGSSFEVCPECGGVDCCDLQFEK